jgi:hypothetical protein
MCMTLLFATVWRNLRTVILLAVVSGTATALTQEIEMAKLNDGPVSLGVGLSSVNSSMLAGVLPEAPSYHKFWDNENKVLFVTVAALDAADFAATRSILQNGGKELNPVTRVFSGSTAGLAVNFTGETIGIIGLSYFFHKTGHHKLERITSLMNIGSSAVAVTYDLTR